MAPLIKPKFRFDSVDQLRGLVIVLMALDHVRDFWGPFPFQPEDLSQTSPELFFTRWITHFCAPIFVFLAGMGVLFYSAKGKTKSEVAQFLLSRGIWLIFLELVWVNFSWKFNFAPWFFVQVIWAIGWSMIFLAAFIYLPKWLAGSLAALMVAGHNLLDPISAQSLGSFDWLWAILHQPYWIAFNQKGAGIYVAYPLIPWIGVMLLGYVFASWLLSKPEAFAKRCVYTGLGLSLIFFLLRFSNFYGDPSIWEVQQRGDVYTLMSFLNTTKYPPSLLFLCMTLGPGLMVLGGWHVVRHGLISRFFNTFGCVPFFFYMLHIAVIHAAAWLYFHFTLRADSGWQMAYMNGGPAPAGYQPELGRVYLVWALVVFGMYFWCRWFKGVKRRSERWWIRYL